MQQNTETAVPNESIFQIQEVPGPVFALKQQGDTVRLPAPSTSRGDATSERHSNQW
ncbi:MAG: hypothetical protein ACRDTG_31265 [Pseudonocardiaceae bacterium]